jgi:Tfp pilus assembly protein PilW
MIEVMVSVMIFLTVLLAIYQLFDSSHATYNSGTRKQDVQQQARLAMDEIVKRLRVAGYYPENFDANTANNIATPAVHIGTVTALAVHGDLDGSNASNVFLFCWNGAGSPLIGKQGPATNAASYTCSGTGDVLADNISQVRFTYYDANNAIIAGTNNRLDDIPLNGAIPVFGTTTDRANVRTIVVTLQATEAVHRQDDQQYTITSTVRLRNL